MVRSLSCAWAAAGVGMFEADCPPDTNTSSPSLVPIWWKNFMALSGPMASRRATTVSWSRPNCATAMSTARQFCSKAAPHSWRRAFPSSTIRAWEAAFPASTFPPIRPFHFSVSTRAWADVRPISWNVSLAHLANSGSAPFSGRGRAYSSAVFGRPRRS